MDPFPLLARLKNSSDTVLLAGAGGGYDVFCALPLYFQLRSWGKEVILGNLSFSPIELMEGERLTNEMLEVTAQTPMAGGSYFPEKFLCEWLDEQLGISSSIYCFERTGVAPICEAYEALVDEHAVDTVVLAGRVYDRDRLDAILSQAEGNASHWSMWPKFIWQALSSPILRAQFAD